MGYWRKKQGFSRKNQELDRRLGKQETSSKRRSRDKENIANKIVAS